MCAPRSYEKEWKEEGVKKRLTKKKEHLNQFTKKFSDHALVISIHPFKGQWIQSRGNANATTLTLTHLILEAVNLTEGAGLKVNGVMSHCAPWNRSMWKMYGVSKGKS